MGAVRCEDAWRRQRTIKTGKTMMKTGEQGEKGEDEIENGKRTGSWETETYARVRITRVGGFSFDCELGLSNRQQMAPTGISP